jgi:hypothetical protein
VLLLGAGPADGSAMMPVPADWPTLMGGEADWSYKTVVQQGLDGAISLPAGQGVRPHRLAPLP